MTLLNHIHNEYVDEDRMAKKEVINRTYNLIRAFQDERKPKTAGQQTLMYQFDQLFNDFRNSVEGILREDLDANQNLNKSFEIIKKYNNLASYIQNIIKINTLPEQDEQLIQSRFKDIEPLLNELVAIANESGFIDRGELSAMVSRIKSLNFTQVSASEKENMMSKIANKNELIQMLTNAQSLIPTIRQQIDDLKSNASYVGQTDPALKNQYDTTIQDYLDTLTEYDQNFQIDMNKFKTIFSNSNATNHDQKAIMNEINDIKTNYSNLLQFHEQVLKTNALFVKMDKQTQHNNAIPLQMMKANADALKQIEADIKEADVRNTELDAKLQTKEYSKKLKQFAFDTIVNDEMKGKDPTELPKVQTDVKDELKKGTQPILGTYQRIMKNVNDEMKQHVTNYESDKLFIDTNIGGIQKAVANYTTGIQPIQQLTTESKEIEGYITKVDAMIAHLVQAQQLYQLVDKTVLTPVKKTVQPLQPTNAPKNVKAPTTGQKPIPVLKNATDIITDLVKIDRRMTHSEVKSKLVGGTPSEKDLLWKDYKTAWNAKANVKNPFKN